MYDIEGITYKTVLEAMDDKRVFDIEKLDSGNFEIIEGCDSCFGAELTKDQLLALSKELAQLATS